MEKDWRTISYEEAKMVVESSYTPLLELSYKEINSLTINDLKERIENLWQKK